MICFSFNDLEYIITFGKTSFTILFNIIKFHCLFEYENIQILEIGILKKKHYCKAYLQIRTH